QRLAQHLGQSLDKLALRVARGRRAAPRDKLIRPHENATGFADFASHSEIAGIVLIIAARSNHMGDDVEAGLGRDLPGRLGPGFAADAGENSEAALAAEVERRDFAIAAIEHPDMRHMRARPRRGLMVKLAV